ncbi:hypothetical protein F511_42446 [Dorcoceras hygrometricum]|uniref:Uncharacterized protein n=1 Tax=Dorcoceras hygrometricum TaxID=472368 RepID=A0A2Z7AB37_9LAMI|nr:hypothetical protein F511_42446 [Dorcoceras hygrometricum]
MLKQWIVLLILRRVCGVVLLVGSRWRRVVVLLVRERSPLRLLSQPISPSSSHSSSWCSSLAVRGFDPTVNSSRRSLVLDRLVQVARVAVVLGLSSVVIAVASILLPSVLVFRALAIFVVSMGISLGCVRQLDRSKSQPRLRVMDDSLGVVLLSFNRPELLVGGEKPVEARFVNAADALVNCVVVAGEETSRGTSREFSSVFCVERYTSSFGVLRLVPAARSCCVWMISREQWSRCIPEPLRVTQVLDSRFPHGYPAQCVEHEKRSLGKSETKIEDRPPDAAACGGATPSAIAHARRALAALSSRERPPMVARTWRILGDASHACASAAACLVAHGGCTAARCLRRWWPIRCVAGRRPLSRIAAPPSRTTVALWRDESGAGRGVVCRWLHKVAGRWPTNTRRCARSRASLAPPCEVVRWRRPPLRRRSGEFPAMS